MQTHITPTQEQQNKGHANEPREKAKKALPASPFMDNRPEAATQRKLQEAANSSPQVMQLRVVQQCSTGLSI